MQIESVDFWKHDLGLQKPYQIAGLYKQKSECVFFRITLSDGTFGIGSGSPSARVCNEDISDSIGGLQRAEAFLKGKSLSNFEALRQAVSELLLKLPAANAAVDIALYDAFCKSIGVSLGDFLGVRIKPIETSVTLGIKDVNETKAEFEALRAAGFAVFKVKIGENIENDIERVRKLGEWGGKDVRIRVDANEGYTKDDLLKFVLATQVEAIEQPFSAPASNEMRELDRHISSHCMADEDLKTRRDAIDLLRRPLPYGSWNIKLMKSGGITNGKWLADYASLQNIPLMWGCMDESIVSISAALHLAYACKNTKYLDLDGSFDLASDLVKGGFGVENGFMIPTGGPGLGVSLL